MLPRSHAKPSPAQAEEGFVVIVIFERGRLALQSANAHGLGRKLLLAGIGLNGRATPDVQARKHTDRKRQAACQIGVRTAAIFELHFAKLVVSAAIVRRFSLFIIIRPRLGFLLRFLVLVVLFGFFRFFRQADRCPIWLKLLGKINFQCAVIAEIVIKTVCIVQKLPQIIIFPDAAFRRQIVE